MNMLKEMLTIGIKTKTENWGKIEPCYSVWAAMVLVEWHCKHCLGFVVLLPRNKFEGEQWCHFPTWLRVKFFWPVSSGLELSCCRTGCSHLLVVAGTDVCVAAESAGSACCFVSRRALFWGQCPPKAETRRSWPHSYLSTSCRLKGGETVWVGEEEARGFSKIGLSQLWNFIAIDSLLVTIFSKAMCLSWVSFKC